MGIFDSVKPKNIFRESLIPGAGATDDLLRGVDHYVQNFGDRMEKMFGKGPQPQGQPSAAPTPLEAPPPSLITPTPIATDSDKQEAQRRTLTANLSRKGRSSTILSDTLG